MSLLLFDPVELMIFLMIVKKDFFSFFRLCASFFQIDKGYHPRLAGVLSRVVLDMHATLRNILYTIFIL